MARIPTKGGKSKKNQGHGVTGASESATNLFPDMRTLGRGLGSSYANAVNHLIDQAPQTKGSTNPSFGVEKKTLDANEFGTYSLLPKSFNPRKK